MVPVREVSDNQMTLIWIECLNGKSKNWIVWCWNLWFLLTGHQEGGTPSCSIFWAWEKQNSWFATSPQVGCQDPCLWGPSSADADMVRPVSKIKDRKWPWNIFPKDIALSGGQFLLESCFVGQMFKAPLLLQLLSAYFALSELIKPINASVHGLYWLRNHSKHSGKVFSFSISIVLVFLLVLRFIIDASELSCWSFVLSTLVLVWDLGSRSLEKFWIINCQEKNYGMKWGMAMARA